MIFFFLGLCDHRERDERSWMEEQIDRREGPY